MEAETVLRRIEGLPNRPIIGPVKGKHLVDAVKRFDVNTVLEVGTLIGYSAILIASNLPHEGRVVTVEVDPESARLAEANIREAGLDDRIEVHVGDALIVLPQINVTFDMIFLDAAKDKYLEYLKLSENKLSSGGVVFADNVKMYAHEMHDYLEYVRNSGRYTSEYIDVTTDGVEVSTKLF